MPEAIPSSVAAFRSDPRWRPYHEASVLARCLCLVDLDGDRILPGPRLFTDWLGGSPEGDRDWDLAISYSSADTELAREIWKQLSAEFRVFFAPEESAYLWGEDLNQVLPNVYGQASRYGHVLSSRTYVERHFTRMEFDATLRRVRRRLLLVDLGAIPEGMPEHIVYRPGRANDLVGLIPTLRAKLKSPERPGGSRRRQRT